MFVITYNNGIRDDLNFMTTYFMMVASFAIPPKCASVMTSRFIPHAPSRVPAACR